VVDRIHEMGWELQNVRDKLVKSMRILENRNRKIAQKWLAALS